MRHKGDVNEYKERQDREIMSAYRRIFNAYGGMVGVGRLYELVSFAPATRFFVSERQAVRVIKRMAEGAEHLNMRGARLRMYTELLGRAERIRTDEGLTLHEAVAAAVRQPAPEMYISPRQISAIIDKERQKCYEMRRQRMCKASADKLA